MNTQLTGAVKFGMTPVYYDVETYLEYFMIHFSRGVSDTFSALEHIVFRCDVDGNMNLDVLDDLFANIDTNVFIGFNNVNFDSIFLDLLYKVWTHKSPFNPKLAYKITQKIIEDDIPSWRLRSDFALPHVTLQLDAMTHLPSMGRIGLKELGMRIGHELLETLPYAPSTVGLTAEERAVIDAYCYNDVHITWKAAHGVARDNLDTKFDVIETLFPGEWWRLRTTNAKMVGQYMTSTTTERYVREYREYDVPDKVSDYLRFKSPALNSVRSDFESFDISQQFSYARSVKVHGIQLDFGLGGLHAMKPGVFKNVIDIDVTSLYPSLIRAFSLFMPFIPQEMQETYYRMIDDRVALKKTNPSLATVYKLVLNSTFGILIDKYNPMYAPVSGYSITITGQLLLAKVIEELALAGYEVIAANTDGVSFIDNGDDVSWRTIVKEWEDVSGLVFEDDYVSTFASRDVNNYVWKMRNGKVKRKGYFETSTTKKAASHLKVVVDSIVEHIANGTPVADYIRGRYETRVTPVEFCLYHKYGKQYDTCGFVRPYEGIPVTKDSVTREFSSAIRYYLANDSRDCIYAFKGDSPKSSQFTDNVAEAFDMGSFDWERVDIDRYISIAEAELAKLILQPVQDRRDMLVDMFGSNSGNYARTFQEACTDPLLTPGSPVYIATSGANFVAIVTETGDDAYNKVIAEYPTIFRLEHGRLTTFLTYGRLTTFRARKTDTVKIYHSPSANVQIGVVGEETKIIGSLVASSAINWSLFVSLTDTQLIPVKRAS